MKTKIIVGLILLITPFAGSSQELYRQYFDGADTSALNSLMIKLDTSATNVWQIGPPQKTIFNSAETLPNALVTDTINSYPPNNISRFSFVIRPDEWMDYGILAIQWQQKLDLADTSAYGYVEYSLPAEPWWENAFWSPYTYSFYGYNQENHVYDSDGWAAFSGTDTTWKNVWLCFDLSWMSQSDSVIFRFTLKSDSLDNNKEGWLIDNFLVHYTMVHTVDEVEPMENMTISPNPTSGRVNIETPKIDEYHIIETMQLLDASGREVQRWEMVPTKFYIDIGHHPEGVYILNVNTNKKRESFKLLLER